MNIVFIDKDPNDFGSYIIRKEVELPSSIKTHQTEWSLFAFLHEIGHVLTNTPKMKRYEQEYLATQWALQEAKELNFKVPGHFIKIYQDYIWKWRETSLKHHAKNVKTIRELTLKY